MSRGRKAPLRSLAWPPEAPGALHGFPERLLADRVPVFRVTSAGRGPWFFSGSGRGRFDLLPPRGTCYLAFDPVVAILEAVGGAVAGGLISSEFLAARRLRSLQLPRVHRVADTTSRRARGFGITAEIATVVPYRLPQAWAAALDRDHFDGLVWAARHDPARGEALAVFGAGGERRRWRRGREEAIGRELVARLRAEASIDVAPRPASGQLRVSD